MQNDFFASPCVCSLQIRIKQVSGLLSPVHGIAEPSCSSSKSFTLEIGPEFTPINRCIARTRADTHLATAAHSPPSVTCDHALRRTPAGNLRRHARRPGAQASRLFRRRPVRLVARARHRNWGRESACLPPPVPAALGSQEARSASTSSRAADPLAGRGDGSTGGERRKNGSSWVISWPISTAQVRSDGY